MAARRIIAFVATAGLALGLAACDDDDRDELADDARDAIEDVEDAAGEASARGVAESLRGVILADDLDGGASRRDVDVLEESVDDLPGEPEVTGIDDGDGDGRDDDGVVEVHVGDQRACLVIGEPGDGDDVGEEDVSVESDCP
jgi:hypothetical protein